MSPLILTEVRVIRLARLTLLPAPGGQVPVAEDLVELPGGVGARRPDARVVRSRAQDVVQNLPRGNDAITTCRRNISESLHKAPNKAFSLLKVPTSGITLPGPASRASCPPCPPPPARQASRGAAAWRLCGDCRYCGY